MHHLCSYHVEWLCVNWNIEDEWIEKNSLNKIWKKRESRVVSLYVLKIIHYHSINIIFFTVLFGKIYRFYILCQSYGNAEIYILWARKFGII